MVGQNKTGSPTKQNQPRTTNQRTGLFLLLHVCPDVPVCTDTCTQVIINGNLGENTIMHFHDRFHRRNDGQFTNRALVFLPLSP